ncbi:flagellar hook-associated protein 3 FlgL [Aequitasia blattaphilus]|uniref:Flagellin N-terminal domain-containing protein n=1 Tax=Aequitasia blattaphilus TaxID=2949332 RepID=A0ABT1EC69_9FIRM|nr:hypothetical protein [Aequitasia blattaphilus]MCP1102542.1 hypothetical protein [Aequitasia blattaphilus]MCR8615182.1 hypothetical protein [Aequitasia blattaphilus]
MRITSGMMRRNYMNNLGSTLGGLAKSRQQVETGRKFLQSYEDPASAAKASVLRMRYARNAENIETAKNTQKWQDNQEDALRQLSDIATEIDKNYSVQGVDDTKGEEGRKALAQSLRELQQSMVASLNAKYGNAYVLAGNDGQNPPFELKDGKVLYRGLDVNDPDNKEALEKLSKETSYIDLGFGLKFDENGGIISSSAFDSAFPGINAVGFGQNKNGENQNLISLAGEMADLLEEEDFDHEGYGKLWESFNEGSNKLKDQLATIGSRSKFLETTVDRLETEKINITEEIDGTINIDAAEAITNFSWASYVYNSALKVGTSVLTPSLLDFLK